MWVTKLAIDVYMYCFSSTLLALLVAVTNKLKYFFSKWLRSQVYIVHSGSLRESQLHQYWCDQWAIGDSRLYVQMRQVCCDIPRKHIFCSKRNKNHNHSTNDDVCTCSLYRNGLRYPKLLRSEQYPLEMINY